MLTPVRIAGGALVLAVGASLLAPAAGRARMSAVSLGASAPPLRPELAVEFIAPLRDVVLDLRPPEGEGAAAEPFTLRGVSPTERARAVRCLANAVYYEAGGETLEGQRAVAQVVLNRVRDPAFPASVCGVVYQGWDRPGGCQFSFTCNGALAHRPNPTAFAAARQVAEQALNGYVMAKVGGAAYYHAVRVDPWWRAAFVRVTRVGAHLFYRWPGLPGFSGAQAYAGGELKIPTAVIEDGRGARSAPRDAPSAVSPSAHVQLQTEARAPGGSGGANQTAAPPLAVS